MLHYFSEIKFANPENLQYGLQHVLNLLTQDQELPVKVEAAVALQYLIKNQPMAEQFIQPHVKSIIQVEYIYTVTRSVRGFTITVCSVTVQLSTVSISTVLEEKGFS